MTKTQKGNVQNMLSPTCFGFSGQDQRKHTEGDDAPKRSNNAFMAAAAEYINHEYATDDGKDG